MRGKASESRGWSCWLDKGLGLRKERCQLFGGAELDQVAARASPTNAQASFRGVLVEPFSGVPPHQREQCLVGLASFVCSSTSRCWGVKTRMTLHEDRPARPAGPGAR